MFSIQKRFQNDIAINSTPVDVLQGQNWESVPWRKLQVGDIVRVRYKNFHMPQFVHIIYIIVG